jgi:hypothetical protein
MAQVKVLKVDANGDYEEHNSASDSIKLASLFTANYELTDTKLGKLVDGADAANEHIHDGRYFRENEFVDASTGVAEAGRPVKLDGAGKLDGTLIDWTEADESQFDHGSLAGLGDDDHTIYTKADGTRAFTGNQSMGGFKLTSLGTPTAAGDAANKSYVDAVATGLAPKGNVAVATVSVLAGTMIANNGTPATGERAYNTTLNTINWFASEGPTAIDGYTLVNGDRILVKSESASSGPSAGEGRVYNGIYVRTSQDVWTRSEDQDNTPLSEIVNGVFIPMVLNGTLNGGKPYFISSIGTGTNGVHTIGTDNIIWDLFTSPSVLTSGDGIDIIGNVVSVDLVSGGGLKFVSTELAVEPSDFAGEGLVDDGSDNLAINWSTAYNDSKAIKASDLSSNANGKGASIIGVEDAGSKFAGTNVESVLSELYDLAAEGTGETYIADGAISKGDLVYFSADGKVKIMPITSAHGCVGIALNSAADTASVKVARWDEKVESVISSATFGTKYYWNGTTLTTTIPSATGAYVWLAGYAVNSTDLLATVEFVKRNSPV